MGSDLSECEIRELLFESEELDSWSDPGRGGTATTYTVVKHPETGGAWLVEWECGLTEMQEHGFYEQPYRVEAYDEVIQAKTVTKWRKVAA